MPNRIVREGILSSERVAKLKWDEEVFYRRLHSIVDDYGRYEANPQLLRSKCYPLQTDDVRVADISRWLTACETAGLILVYEVNGKCYVEVTNFGQQQRTASKYPPQTASDSKCLQPIANEHLGVSVFVSESVNTSAPSGARFDRFWDEYPKKKAKDAAKRAFDKRKPDEGLLTLMIDAIRLQMKSDAWQKEGGQFIPYPATWLNEGRWQDEETTIAPAAPRHSTGIEETQRLLADQAAHKARATLPPPEIQAQIAKVLRRKEVA